MMASSGRFAHVPSRTDSGRREASQPPALARSLSSASLASASTAPQSALKRALSSGYGQISVAAAPPPPPPSAARPMSRATSSASLSRRQSISASALSLSFVAAAGPDASLRASANLAPALDEDASPLRRGLLAVIAASCAEASALATQGLVAQAREAYAALLAEVPLARRRAAVWEARATLEERHGATATAMELLLEGAEACRTAPAEHALVTQAIGRLARNALAPQGGRAAALVEPAAAAAPTEPSAPATTSKEDDPFLLESLGLTGAVPILSSRKAAAPPLPARVAESEDAEPSLVDLGLPATFAMMTPRVAVVELEKADVTERRKVAELEADSERMPVPAAPVPTPTAPALSAAAEDALSPAVPVSFDLGIDSDLASPPKAVLKTASKPRLSAYLSTTPPQSAFKSRLQSAATPSGARRETLGQLPAASPAESKTQAPVALLPAPAQRAQPASAGRGKPDSGDAASAKSSRRKLLAAALTPARPRSSRLAAKGAANGF